MRIRVIIMILAILSVALASGIAAKSDDGSSGGNSGQETEVETNPSVTQELEHLQTPGETLSGSQGRETEIEQHRSRETGVSVTSTPEQELEVEIHGEGRVRSSSDELRGRIQELEQELELEHGTLASGERQVLERHRNVSAFVHVLQNESFTSSIMGRGTGGIGPQVAQYARAWNASLQAQVRAEERIQGRNMLVRLFLGGDREAGQALEQEAIRNEDRIRQMQQLILQCQACDPQVKAVLQEQLQQREEEQARIREEAQREIRDTGLFGWIGR